MKADKKLIIAVYDNEKKAQEEFDILFSKEKKDELDLSAYTVITKKENGKTELHDTVGRDAFWGAVIGGLVMLLIGPFGAIYGAALFTAEVLAGSMAASIGVGALAGWLKSDALNIPIDLIKDIKDSLKPGSSAIVAVAEEDWVDDVERLLKPNSEMMHEYQFNGSVVEKFENDWKEHHKQEIVE
ncbi:DUF1269 domain-containing protein [Flammeovirga yaeyamensis]|uniref:DUF1269 domain-containing protein n=1 Tax=Flammeovirga yaeyamensis TaxID=367791 RepID=A0AAX1N7U4_9BACT|nr:DUF1269 domain-containing protein [Flammeovirga yaeyamensis]MBB3699079.1 putative membrane protein [Flammeovirga yaeyamensis]NMF36513.1 DUF1269 domain-containing protein [Flammeovirga yaeyamensis]QWG03529.1 DUF1269 domain-containing protein [Flammeovirga yaeyamensis]